MSAAPGTLGLLVGASSSKNTSSSSSTLLILVLLGAAFYFLLYRPQKKKQRMVRTQSNSYEVGDEVVTAGGIVGHVLDIDDDRVTLETSVGASFVVLRPYILRKLEPPAAPPDVVDGLDLDDDDVGSDDDEHDEHGHNAVGDDAGGEAPEPTDGPGTDGPAAG